MNINTLKLDTRFNFQLLLQALKGLRAKKTTINKVVSLMYSTMMDNHIMPEINNENISQYLSSAEKDFKGMLNNKRKEVPADCFVAYLEDVSAQIDEHVFDFMEQGCDILENDPIYANLYGLYENALQYIAINKVIARFK